MNLRAPGLNAALLSILIIGSGFDDPLRAEDVRQDFSSVSAARARFLTRIREMLNESAKMEVAGRPDDAMLIAVRASRMLDALGGETAWPRGETSPAQVVALLADRHGPGSPAQPDRDQRAAQPEPPQAGKHESSKAVVAPQQKQNQAETSSAFNRFPDIPAASRSWVPVGTPKSGDWTPVALPPTSENARTVVHQAAAEQLMQIPAFSQAETENGSDATGSDSATISDLRVGPIPVHPTPEIRPVAGIDIRASEEPQEFRPDAQPVSMTDRLSDSPFKTASDEISAASTDASTNQPHSVDGLDNVSQSVPLVAEADQSRVLIATLVGAAAGILLVLIGGLVVRRFDRTAAAPVARSSEEEASTIPEMTVDTSLNEPLVSEVAWQPGSSWVGPQPDPSFEMPLPTSSEYSSQPAPGPQLQIFHGPSENDTDVEPENAVAAETDVDLATGAKLAQPVAPADPFRVIGTEVVLGEAASAKVDEELLHRRKRIMQAVFEENVAMQSLLDNTHGGEAA